MTAPSHSPVICTQPVRKRPEKALPSLDTGVRSCTERVLDIVRLSTGNVAGSARAGVLGTVVIDDAITELLDVDALLGAAREMGLDLTESSLRILGG